MDGFAGIGMGFLEIPTLRLASLRTLEEGKGRVGLSVTGVEGETDSTPFFTAVGALVCGRDGEEDADEEEDVFECACASTCMSASASDSGDSELSCRCSLSWAGVDLGRGGGMIAISG